MEKNPKILFLINKALIGLDPIGVMQLSAIAKQNDCRTYICLAWENYIDIIKITKPELIAVSMMSTDYFFLKRIISKIKETYPAIPIIAGGPHPTFKPDDINSMDVDAICVGEGDMVFPKIIQRLRSGKSFEGISNIHTKNEKNPLCPLIEDLDQLPFVDRGIIYDHIPAFERFKLRVFSSSRGCPYSCSYCFNHAYNKLYNGLGRIVRRRSVDHLIAEIKRVKNKYSTEFIKFSDDSFAHRVDQWLEDFAETYKKKVNLPFYCLIRPDRINEEMVKLLKYAGCKTICMSIETGNEKIRKEVLKRNVSTDQIIKSFDMFHKYGIKILTNNLLAIPGSSIAHEMETLDLNIRCKPEFSGFAICIPFPGTDIYTYCKKNNLLKDGMDDEKIFSAQDASVLNTFPESERKVYRNLTFLGPFIVIFPFLKQFVIERLVHLPVNIVFKIFCFVLTKYQMKVDIIPMKYSFVENILIIKEILLYEVKKSK